ncbi:MAG TPA: glycosyltransferase [Pyrinomonadaceae bacterium]
MRLQKITNASARYIAQFYAQRAGLASESYERQHAALMADCFGWADFWSVALARLGFEAQEVVANVAPMQRRWALEHGLAFDESSGALEITAAQVKAFRPDLLFVDDHHGFPAPFLRQLRRECPSIRLILGWCGAPYDDPAILREYDLVLSCIPELVQQFREDGHAAHHLNHAFEPRILERIENAPRPSVDFAFIGSIVKRPQFHTQRERLLLDLLAETNLQVWAEIHRPSRRERAGALLRRTAYDAVRSAEGLGLPRPLLGVMPGVRKVARWEARPALPQAVDERLHTRVHPPIFGVAMFQQLHDSKVALNTHIDISPLSASNMRLFEATGVGTCLLTDWKANQSELFEPDVEMISYRSSEECIEKVRYLLDHDEERRQIALAGQRRTLACHTFAQRAEQLDALVRNALGGKA